MELIVALPDGSLPVEIGYWLVVMAAGVLAYVLSARREAASTKYKKGQEEARQYLADGVPSASIESFLRVQRDGGYYGPHEAGMDSVLRGGQK